MVILVTIEEKTVKTVHKVEGKKYKIDYETVVLNCKCNLEVYKTKWKSIRGIFLRKKKENRTFTLLDNFNQKKKKIQDN